MVLICSLSNQTIIEYNTQTSLENTKQTSTITDNNQVQNKTLKSKVIYDNGKHFLKLK